MNKGCPKCGRMIQQNNNICPYCNYDFKEIDTFFKTIEKEQLKEEKYAGLIKRLVAGIIDLYITIVLALPIFIKINKKITKDNIWLFSIILFIIYVFYNSFLERTKFRGSIGKKITNIEVTDEYENPVTLPKAFIRNISKILNILTLGLGFIICAITPSKQTLGDKISKTYVINKIKLKEEKNIKVAKIYKRLLAFIIDIIYISILIIIEYYAIVYLSNNNIIEETTLYKTIALIIILLYFPFNESRKGKTKGKKILKIKITNLEEEKISFTTSLLRYLLILIDIMTLGFLLSLTNTKKQTLKDIMTKTIIIDD